MDSSQVAERRHHLALIFTPLPNWGRGKLDRAVIGLPGNIQNLIGKES